jgi:circadian clock protein KaiB
MQEAEKIENQFTFQLFIVGVTTLNNAAIKNCKTILDAHLHKKYSLEIIDISQNPSLAKKEEIIGTPLLIMKKPTPEIRMVGDFSDSKKFLKKFAIL